MAMQVLSGLRWPGAFFVPESVLSGGGMSAGEIDTHPQANMEMKQPSPLGQAGFLRPLP